ncbi:MAG: ribonuclease H-like YkuK family protein [Bacillota bacterium]|nr:ribonuclease H-like YkuK family protein [Bacillota bacterium]
MVFISPTKGKLSFNDTFKDIMSYMQEVPGIPYKLIIGTDSQLREDACFVTAIVVHRVGKGARYYYTKERERMGRSLRQRIFYETAKSLGVASKLAEKLAKNGYGELDVEIHLDIGQNGETRDLIREIVGMVAGTGFAARIKPDSYGASKVADKHTK